jgi:hypothetical protein
VAADDGITDGNVLLRLATVKDVDGLMPAFADAELREAGNLPASTRAEAVATIPHPPGLTASRRLLSMIALDATTGEVVDGGVLDDLDAEVLPGE